ncbi:MAG: hypothetical protein LV479_09965 [Methylacidiphilales bacterium]|nr:hypothetical protein [Candidatus Methylacidiphilales bacterium]
MIPLETEFYSRGFCHKQTMRVKFTAIFARFRRSDPEKVIHYEVVTITPGKPYNIAGINFPAKEQYPCSEQWGEKGWTYLDEDQARSRFEMLLAVGRDVPGRWLSVANESLVNPIKGTPPRAGARDSR